MLAWVTNRIKGLSLEKYSNDILFALILFIASFTAITTIVRTQERSLESDLILNASLIKDAVINQSKLNFLLSDSIGFSELYDQIFENSEHLIKASFYDQDGNLLWTADSEYKLLEEIIDIREDKEGVFDHENSIYVNFPVFDNADESLGYMLFECNTQAINLEIKSLRVRLFVLSSLLIITLLAISLWARSKLLLLTRTQAFSKARIEISEKNNAQLEAENKILGIISGRNNLYDIGLEVVKFVGEYLKTPDTVMFAYLDGELIKIASLRALSSGKSEIETFEKLELGQGICGSVALSRKGRIVSDTALDKDYIVDGQKMRSEITVPIIIDDELVGVLDAEHATVDFFTKEHFEFLMKISNLIALGLKNSISRTLIDRKDSELQSLANRLENIIENLQQLIKEMNNGDNLIINYTNLFTYPSAELLIIILNLFHKVKVYYCKILKQNVLYCINYKNLSNITVFVRNILIKWKSNIRQFGIYINSTILDLIKIHNTFIFDYYLNLNDNIADSTLEDKEFFFKHYCKKYSKTNSSIYDCNHSLKEYNLEKCYICIRCNELFSLH